MRLKSDLSRRNKNDYGGRGLGLGTGCGYRQPIGDLAAQVADLFQRLAVDLCCSTFIK